MVYWKQAKVIVQWNQCENYVLKLLFLKAHTSVFVISYFIDELLFWNVATNRCFKTFEWLFITVLSAGNTKTNIKPADKSETLTAIAKTEAAFRHSSGFMEG